MFLELQKRAIFQWLKPDLSSEKYRHIDQALIEQLLSLAEQLGLAAMAPIAHILDRNPPHLHEGKVQTPAVLKDALHALAQAGIFATRAPLAEGGTALPALIHTLIAATLNRFDATIYGYVLLTQGAANLIRSFGNESQRARFLPAMVAGEHFGTMCLSEPHAGSNLSDLRCKAKLLSDGRYAISGNKMWISGAQQEVSGNIIHLVLARIEGAPAGTKGLSLFIVPRFLNGSVNNVVLSGLNHKMGFRGTVNGALNFGDGGICVGEILGAPHQGMAQMFQMMNEARIAVGVGAAAMGWRGYELACDYAKARLQGRRLGNADPSTPQVPIIEHMDVRRMLMKARAQSEGALLLCWYGAHLEDLSHADPTSAKLLGLLTPMIKSWPSKYALEANDLAIQVLGGAGYTQDYLLEKLYRDNRLNPIHEGTHGIQAQDLLARKIIQDDGQALLLLLQRMADTAKKAAADVRFHSFAPSALELGTALAQLALASGAKLKAAEFDQALGNASLWMDAFGTVVVCWLSLDFAIQTGDARALENCRYLHDFELEMARAALIPLQADLRWLRDAQI
jgi:alkylation response protein AidB-like acyl-CoA dehydrogenase